MVNLFVRILHMGFSAGYLIFAVLGIRFLLKKAPKTMRIFLWLLVGIRLLLPFSIESAFCLIPDSQSANERVDPIELPRQAENIGSKAVQGPQNPLPAADLQSAPIKVRTDDASWYIRLAAGIWIAGMATMAAYMLVSWIKLANRVQTAVPVNIAANQGTIKVYRSERIDSPFLFGIIRPRIYIPERIADRDIPYVVVHEETHRRRKDHLIKLVGFLILSVYWFHPLVWISYMMLCRDIELVCDEQVIRKLGEPCKKAYSQALLSSAVNHRTIAACPVAFGEIGVRERVKNVLHYKKPAFWLILAAAAACAAVPVCFMTQPKAAASQPDNGSLAGIYEMKESGEALTVPRLTLDGEGNFTFYYDALSSYMPVGSYEQKGTILTAVTEDGKYHYQFTLTDNGELVFDEAHSSEITPMNDRIGTAVSDGSVFVKKEDNPSATGSSGAEIIGTESPQPEAAQNSQSENTGSENSQNAKPDDRIREEVEKWAQAFCDRDGKTIAGMLDDNARQELTDKCNFTPFEDGSVEFGFSSPWPWGTNWDDPSAAQVYRIVSQTDSSAVILYYAWVSDPHVTVWREQITYKTEGDRLAITSESIRFMNNICTAEEFEQAYPMQIIAGTMMDYYSYNGAGETLNNRGTDQILSQPDTAAVCLLNLLDNQNKVSTEVITDDTDENICTVVVTFHLPPKKSVSITMIRPYGANGIWVPYSDAGASGLSSANKTEEWNVDDIIKSDSQTLETLFPEHHNFALNNDLTRNVDLDGDGVEEKIELTDLHYNGGDGGYALTVTDTRTGEAIPLPDGYTKENGFPIIAEYAEPELTIGFQTETGADIAKISGGALLRIYERRNLRGEAKELMLKYNTFDSRIDAISGFNIITREGDSTPTLVLKSYVSGTMGHADTLGYIITELKLQKDHTFQSKHYFLLDSCRE